MNKSCPCGSRQSYDQCCELIISAKKDATTCLELMRSRYVAFTLTNVDYLMLSHHSETRPAKERKSIQKWAESVHWMGLVILNTQSGEASDDIGFVEFRALYMEAGKMQERHEKSLFKRENQKWVYVSGEHF
ncbi:MAG: SEC-C domain-containing protein [Prolixibacteraceae bacterium]|nr:SEC-C domain-containing protein [Prolixibacteraceae bacterium]